MKEYSEDYNSIFELWVNKHISASYPINNEVKQWLINEREGKLNILSAIEVEEKLVPIINLSENIIQIENEIELCSFNLNIEYVFNILKKLRELRTRFSLNYNSDEIPKFKIFAEQELNKIRIHMQTTYQPISFKELLNKQKENYFRNTINSNILELKDILNELRYVSNGRESINKILNKMLYDLMDLEFTKKRIHEYYEKNKKVHESDLQKYYDIENALVDKFTNLKTYNETAD
jgi:hypothetical protein